MRSWGISVRFALSTFIFILPIVTLMFQLHMISRKQLNFSAKEKTGQELLNNIVTMESQLLDAHLDVLKTSLDTDTTKNENLTKAWESLEKTFVENGQNTDALKENFAKYLNASGEQKSKESLMPKLYSSMVVIKKQIADTFNVTIDPDLDSFYVAYTLVHTLPFLQEHYLEIAALTKNATAENIEKSKQELSVILNLLGHYFTDAEDNLKKAQMNDLDFNGELPSFQENFKSYSENIHHQAELFTSLSKSAETTLANPSSTLETVAALTKKNSELSVNLSKDFGQLISSRVEYIESARNRNIFVGALSTLLAILFTTYLGYTINATVKTFKMAVTQLRSDAKLALDVGQNLIQTSSKVSHASSSQAAAIEETSASMEELSSMVAINAENSQKAREMAGEAKKHASQGGSEMENLIISMNEISASSKKIEEIMKIIDDIAFQTNLLALNASVEAARAGEHGKGFAVVADAVRSLAHKSAESAKEIGSLISDSLQKIEHGKASVDRSGASMKSILTSIENVNALNGEIAHASHEQTAGIQQISKAISELERSTIENSSVAQQSSEFSNKSLTQAEGLMRLVDLLESELEGKSTETNLVEKADFNFQDAIQAHLKWKGRLKNYIDGVSQEKLDHSVVCKDNQCPLGKWIYGNGQKFNTLATFGVLKQEHALFHEAAGAIVKAVQNHDPKASQMLAEGGDFDHRTRSTVAALQELDQEIR